jgi:hypothetical protein
MEITRFPCDSEANRQRSGCQTLGITWSAAAPWCARPLNNTHASATEKGGKGFQVVDLADEANGVKNEALHEIFEVSVVGNAAFLGKNEGDFVNNEVCLTNCEGDAENNEVRCENCEGSA